MQRFFMPPLRSKWKHYVFGLFLVLTERVDKWVNEWMDKWMNEWMN